MHCLSSRYYLGLLLLVLGVQGEASDLPDFATFLYAAASVRGNEIESNEDFWKIPVLEGIMPAKNPGPQKDIGLTVEARNLLTNEQFAEAYPNTDFSRANYGGGFGIRGLDCSNGDCNLAENLFSERLVRAIEKWTPALLSYDYGHDETGLSIERLDDESYLVQLFQRFRSDRGADIVAVIVSDDLSVKSAFRIPLSSQMGIKTGHDDGEEHFSLAAIQGVHRVGESLIIAVGANPHLCYATSERQFEFLVKFSLRDYKVEWTSPFNTSDGAFAVADDIIYSAVGGSCRDDYLYAIDVNNGEVIARDSVPKSFDWLLIENGRLFGKTYDNGYVYRLD